MWSEMLALRHNEAVYDRDTLDLVVALPPNYIVERLVKRSAVLGKYQVIVQRLGCNLTRYNAESFTDRAAKTC